MINQLPTLAQLFAEHSGKVSDKWSIYITEYDRLFQPYRDQPVRLLEIGIQNGGSLEIWSKYFTNAIKFIGCDINPDCAKLQFDDPRITVVVSDANTDETQRHILKLSPVFDLMIDDGSHHSGDIVRSFARYFPHLNDGGLYIAEDLHCSYWQDFEGGLFQPYSSIAFFKQLADTINHEHWGIDKSRIELLRSFNRQYNTRLDDVSLAHIHSIEFINSMCVVRKAIPADNVLGQRFISGTIALVDEAPIPLHGSSCSQPDQSINTWATKDVPVDELANQLQKIVSLNQAMSERDKKTTGLIKAILAQDKNAFQKAFDAEWYVEKYPDVDTAEMDPYQHYVEFGIAEGRLPAADTIIFMRDAFLECSIDLHQVRQIAAMRRAELIEREKAFAEQLQSIQQAHAQQTNEQRHEQAEREQALADQLTQARQQIEIQMRELIEREKAFAEQLQSIQQAHAQQTNEQRHEQAEREQALADQLTQARQQLETQMRELNERERNSSQQIQNIQQQYEQQKVEQSNQFAERERNYLAQLSLVREQLEAQLRELIERERAFSEQLQNIQEVHERQTNERHEQAEREQNLNTLLFVKQGELYQLTRNWLEAEQVQTKTLNQLHEQLNAMHNTFSWRLTAPLRNIARLLGNNEADSVEDKNDVSLPPPLVLRSSKDELSTNNAIYQSETQNKSNNTSKFSNYLLTESNIAQITGISNMSQNQPNIAASTLDELLSYNDEHFIRCAYLTLLGRTPDADGMAFYLKKIRAGISKTQILYQMKSGKEGKSHQTNLTGLDKLIRIRRWITSPLLHTFFCKWLDGGYTGKKLRILENQLYQLDEKNKNYHVKIDMAISNLRKLIVQQVQSVIATHNDVQQPKADTLSIAEKHFDAEWYLRIHTDVALSGIIPYEHYKKYGRYENRSARYFDAPWYSRKYPDISKCGLDPYDHYIKYGKAEGREIRYFNPQTHLYFNGGASECSCDPYEYYVNLGLDEDRETKKFAPIKVDYLDDEAINYFGYIRAVSGLGNASRGYIHALQHCGRNVSSLNLPCGLEELDYPVETIPNEFAMFNIVHMNADSIQYFFNRMGKDCLNGRYNIGLWVWELAAFRPDWYDSFKPFHEIWVPSEFCKQSISAISPVPVYVIPHIVEEQVITDSNNRSYFDLPEEVFIFGYMFDCSSSIARKNPFSLIEAFLRAFNKNEKVILLLKISNGDLDPERYQTIRKAIDGHHNIQTIERTLNETDVRRFFDVIDCYVSPHRSEGFGLTIAEAMLAGKPVIATDYGGSTDFVKSEHAYPVRYSMVPINQQHGPYLPGYIWAEPDTVHLIERLKEVYEHQEIAFLRGKTAYRFVKEKYSVDRIADIMINRFKMILQKNSRMLELSPKI